MSRLRRILHPTDFSPASRAGFTRAVSMAKKERAELLLVHVVAPLVTVAGGGPVSPHMYDGREIETAARSKKADLIVIGTHGRTGLARLFLGSVAARVVAGAPCPVLTVRGR